MIYNNRHKYYKDILDIHNILIIYNKKDIYRGIDYLIMKIQIEKLLNIVDSFV